MKSWNKDNIVEFEDDNNTKFIKGPFTIEGNVYDYKLIDESGEDYCTIGQMETWDVEMARQEK